MSLPIHPQEYHFNVNGFQKQREERLIQFLLHETENGWFIWPNKVTHSLRRARDMLRNEFNFKISMEQLHKHVEFLNTRHDTFRGLRENPLVQWEYRTNTFHACDIVWNELREVNKDIDWYYFKGEYAYVDLIRIFSGSGAPETGVFGNNNYGHDTWVPTQQSHAEYPSPTVNLAASPSLQELSENAYHSSMKKDYKKKPSSAFDKIKKKLFRANDEGPSDRDGGKKDAKGKGKFK